MNKNLLYAALGLGAAYLIFGRNNGNANVPPPQPGGVTVPGMTPANEVPVITINTTPRINATQYGNCQCADGSMCVGRGDCSCCTKGAIKQPIHTIILPVAKTGYAPAGARSAGILG